MVKSDFLNFGVFFDDGDPCGVEGGQEGGQGCRGGSELAQGFGVGFEGLVADEV